MTDTDISGRRGAQSADRRLQRIDDSWYDIFYILLIYGRVGIESSLHRSHVCVMLFLQCV